MALSLQASVLVKRRAFNYYLKPGVTGLVKWLFEYFSQFKGNPDLQIVPFGALTSGDTVIANVACTLYAIVLTKATATKTFFKLTDNATTASTNGSQDITIPVSGAGNSIAQIYPDGMPMASGITITGDTTATGNSGSGANGVAGYLIIGA